MAIVINANDGSISGLSVGGLPDGTVDSGTLATNSVDSAELIDGSIDNSHLAISLNGLTDVSLDITNFADSLLIQPNSDGSAPTTGTLSSASDNTGIGANVFTSLTDGIKNSVYGGNALYTNSTGDNNTAIGHQALYDSTGDDNTAVGMRAGRSITGTLNTIIGCEAGYNTTASTTADYMTIIGAYSHVGPGAGADDNQIIIGYDAQGYSPNWVVIGNGSTDIACQLSGTSWTNPSDERIKKDIETSTAGLSFINDLRPVTFRYKDAGDIPDTFRGFEEGSTIPVQNTTHNHGFIAQEVKTALDNHPEVKDGQELWFDGVPDNGRQRIGQTGLIPMLVKAVQELSARIETLENP
jgi:hypothetical protein